MPFASAKNKEEGIPALKRRRDVTVDMKHISGPKMGHVYGSAKIFF